MSAPIFELLSKIETAIQISKVLHEKHFLLEANELKTKFNELANTLMEVKMALPEVIGIIGGKDKQIKELEEALKTKDTLVCVRDAYYVKDQKGRPSGDAHCVKCWENTYKKRKLIVKTDDPQVKICPTCGQTYSRIETENIKRKSFFFKFW